MFADLREEIDRVLAAHNGQITDEGLKEMTFLDRFIRQVLRLGVDKLATGKKAMEDFTFNNGYQVPEGRFVQSLSRRIMYDSYTVDSALEELDPFTYTKREAAQTGRDNVAFGLGKHMCRTYPSYTCRFQPHVILNFYYHSWPLLCHPRNQVGTDHPSQGL